MYKGIVLDSDDNVTLHDYKGYEDIRDVVGGVYSICGYTDIDIPMMGTTKVALFCNDEFLINDGEEFDKINASASLISGQEIRGNVFVLADMGNNCRGFEYVETDEGEEDICECWMAEDILMRFISNNMEEIRALHSEYDNNKSIPQIEVYGLDEFDDMEM